MFRNLCLGLFLVALLDMANARATPVVPCQLCRPADDKAVTQPQRRPLRIEIDSALDFSSFSIEAGKSGTAEVDPYDGTRRVSGGLIGLSGRGLKGKVRVIGEPFARISVQMPEILELRSPVGGTAIISAIKTSLPSVPLLGPTGELSFSFGGKMTVSGSEAGDFQGRFPISVDYQ